MPGIPVELHESVECDLQPKTHAFMIKELEKSAVI